MLVSGCAAEAEPVAVPPPAPITVSGRRPPRAARAACWTSL
ncbi:hypothetical protein NKG94_24410 [Micromonospora sp. M12]